MIIDLSLIAGHLNSVFIDDKWSEPCRDFLNFFFRIAKEKQMYEKEVVDQRKKVEKMKEENKDEYDIKKQVCFKLENKTIHSTVEALPGVTQTKHYGPK